MLKVVCVMASYFLDTSVASLILDGELFKRRPDLMYRYMPELANSTSEEVRQHDSIQRVIAAYGWCKQFTASGGKLMITPTVMLELMSAPQVT